MIRKYKKIVLSAILASAFITPTASAKLFTEDTINQQLIQMESPAEDMLDELENKNTDKLKQQFTKISNAMDELNRINRERNSADALSRKIALQNSWFNLVSVEITEMDDLSALASVINQFSGQLIVTTQFEHEYGRKIAWMDYLGRELLILNKYPSTIVSNEALIKTRKSDLYAAWQSIKTIISDRKDGAGLTHKVDTVIQAIMTETNAKELIALSEKELDLVDNIEEYFHIE